LVGPPADYGVIYFHFCTILGFHSDGLAEYYRLENKVV
jgi:hypothetical protein